MLTDSFDLAVLLLRVVLGGVIFAHGWNHLFGAGGVEGTARWFGGLGFRPPKVHALMSGGVELAAGTALVLGLLTTAATAAVIGTMAVAGWVAHRPNGFFIFRDGYEYVLVVAVAALVLAILGPGSISLDSVLGIVDYSGTTAAGLLGGAGALVAAVGGLGGAVALLALGWKPEPQAARPDA